MKRRLVLLLGLCGLALAALPPLLGQALPPGTELRLLSPDLKTLFAAWRLEGNRLLPLSQPLAPRPGTEVRLLLSVPGKKPQVLPGVAAEGDVLLLLGKERVSLVRLLQEAYGVALPGRLWP